MSEGSDINILYKRLFKAQKRVIEAEVARQLKQQQQPPLKKAKTVKKDKQCNGLLYPKKMPCPGGARSDKISVWRSGDKKTYCVSCLGKNKRAAKKRATKKKGYKRVASHCHLYKGNDYG